MIDLHNHILPGVDDGAADLDESLAIARQLRSEGVIAVVATPHLDPLNRRGAHGADVRAVVETLRHALHKSQIDLEILPGHELYLTPDVPDLLKDGTALPLAAGPYALVELPMSQRPLYLEDTLYRLQQAGYRVILAHPSRYGFVQQAPECLEPLVRGGMILQVTAPSYLGSYGSRVQRTVRELISLGLCALASSDRHHPGSSRSLRDVYLKLSAEFGGETAQLLLEQNPARVVVGEDLLPPAPVERRQHTFFGRLFGSR